MFGLYKIVLFFFVCGGKTLQRGPRYPGYTYHRYEGNEGVEKTPTSLQINALESIIVGFSYFLVILTLPVSLLFALKVRQIILR